MFTCVKEWWADVCYERRLKADMDLLSHLLMLSSVDKEFREKLKNEPEVVLAENGLSEYYPEGGVIVVEETADKQYLVLPEFMDDVVFEDDSNSCCCK